MKRLIAATCLASLAVATLVATSSAAAVPVFQGTVGPSFTIKLAKKPTKAGKVKIVVADRSSSHDFHLTGPGVNVTTSVGGTGTKTFTVTLKKGTYRYVCDPHASFMRGSFTIR
jgi:plastocyanin